MQPSTVCHQGSVPQFPSPLPVACSLHRELCPGQEGRRLKIGSGRRWLPRQSHRRGEGRVQRWGAPVTKEGSIAFIMPRFCSKGLDTGCPTSEKSGEASLANHQSPFAAVAPHRRTNPPRVKLKRVWQSWFSNMPNGCGTTQQTARCPVRSSPWDDNQVAPGPLQCRHT
jgi:hypothetical protein